MVWATVTTVLSDPPSGTHPSVTPVSSSTQVRCHLTPSGKLHCDQEWDFSIVLLHWVCLRSLFDCLALLSGHNPQVLCCLGRKCCSSYLSSPQQAWGVAGTRRFNEWLNSIAVNLLWEKCIRLRFWLAASPVLALQSQLETDNNELKT